MRLLCTLVLLLATATCGCTLDAVFDLTLQLPPDEDGTPTHAVIEAAPSDARFGHADFEGVDWRTAGRDGFLLVSGDTSEATLSVVSDDAGEHDRPLLLRIRLCSDDRCADDGDESAREAHLEIERAFYAGEITAHEIATSTDDYGDPVDFPDPEPPPDAGPIPDGGPCLLGPIPPTPGVIRVGRCEVRGCLIGSTDCFCRRDGTHYCE